MKNIKNAFYPSIEGKFENYFSSYIPKIYDHTGSLY